MLFVRKSIIYINIFYVNIEINKEQFINNDILIYLF